MHGACPHHVKRCVNHMKIYGHHTILSGVSVKNCFAVGCSNVYRKGSGVRFVSDPERNTKLGVRIGHQMSILGWLCSQHTQERRATISATIFWLRSILIRICRYSPVKRRLEGGMGKFHRRQAMKRRQTMERSVAICGTVSEGSYVYEIPAASCSSSIQAVDDNEETNSSNGEAQILSEIVMELFNMGNLRVHTEYGF